MKRFILRAAVALIFSTGAVHAVDLATVLQNAKEYDASYASAASSYEAGKEKAVQGHALLMPTVSLSGNYARQVGSETISGYGTVPNTGYNTYGYQLQAQQPLYDASRVAGNTQLHEQANLAEINFRAAEQDLIIRVAQVYFDVLYAQDSLEYVRSQKQAVFEQLSHAKTSYEVGEGNITDTHEAQAQYDSIIADEIAAENDLQVKQAAFVQVTGMQPDNLEPLGLRQRPVPAYPDDVSVWMNQAKDSSPLIAAKRSALSSADAEIEKYRAQKQATLSLQAGYGDSRISGLSVPGTATDSKGGSIGLVLNVPLYTGGNTSSRLRESLNNRDAARHDVEATLRSVELNTRQAFLGVRSGAAQIKALEQALISSQSSKDSTELGKDVGVRTTLDVLNVQQSYFLTKRNLANARYQYEMNRLKLAQSVGVLGAADVDAVNRELGK